MAGFAIIPDDTYNVFNGKPLLEAWLTKRAAAIKKITDLFDEDGKLVSNEIYPAITATAFNDLYKWTMMPVIRTLEENKGNTIVTFGIDLRDEQMVTEMNSEPELIIKIREALQTLTTRPFDRTLFDSVLVGPRSDILTTADKTAICSTSLADKFEFLGERPESYKPNDAPTYTNEVVVAMYKTDKGWFIEATGPWHRVTWLETSMMQCVYEAKLRYDLSKQGKSYGQWVYGALLRCAKSTLYNYAMNPYIVPALFAGRRTGGLVFALLENLFIADHFNQFSPGPPAQPLPGGTFSDYTPPTDLIPVKKMNTGTSSCECWYILCKRLDLPCLNPVGTHAHELSMVSSILFPYLDTELPYSQIITHYLYNKIVFKAPGLAPMLPDTLGTRAFLHAASSINIDSGRFLDTLGLARQDSGRLEDFKTNMAEFEYKNRLMASEIDTMASLKNASDLGFGFSGMGGFFGDSEKVWGNPYASSNSMAVKAVRVRYTKNDHDKGQTYPGYCSDLGNDIVEGYPVKTGDPKEKGKLPDLNKGKLSLDKNLPEATIQLIKDYALGVHEKAQAPYTKTGSLIPMADIVKKAGLNTVVLQPRATGQGQGGGRRRKTCRRKSKLRRTRK